MCREQFRTVASKAGASRTAARMASGHKPAISTATWQPTEWPTTTARWMPVASSHARNAAASPAIPKREGGRWPRPKPGRSGAYTRNSGASVKASGTM